jgi:carbamoylphosphate synthase large subunit
MRGSKINASHTVLLGTAGTGTAFAAACALRRHWSQTVRIIAMDTNPQHLVTASLLSDCFEGAPLSASLEFPEIVRDIIHRHDVDTYLPLLPHEVEIATKLRAQNLMPSNVALLAPSSLGSTLCADKWLLTQALQANSIPVPLSAVASDPFPAEEYFLKPRSGYGSHGAVLIEAGKLQTATGRHAEDWIVQQRCAPPEITVDAFYCASSGLCKSICRERIEVKAGVSTKCRLFEDPQLHVYARGIANILGIEGSFCFQVMRSDASWVVTDVNPRPGAGSAMCNMTGNDFFAASFARAWAESVNQFFTPLQGDFYVTRQYCDFAMCSSN